MEGGYYWATYKAICRRDGAYTNSNGLHDFNSQLTEPLLKHLGGGWERAFQRRLPNILRDYVGKATRILREFHRVIEDEARRQGVGLAGMSMLAQQLGNYSQSFKNVADQMVAAITEMQRTASREFTPVVREHMLPAYEVCTNERGMYSCFT